MSNRDSELTKSVRAAEAAGTERPQPERMSGILKLLRGLQRRI